jgi:hypothetical protein
MRGCAAEWGREALAARARGEQLKRSEIRPHRKPHPFVLHNLPLATPPSTTYPLPTAPKDGLLYGMQMRWRPRDSQDRSTILRRRRRAGARGQRPAPCSPAQKRAAIQCLPRGPSGSQIWYGHLAHVPCHLPLQSPLFHTTTVSSTRLKKNRLSSRKMDRTNCGRCGRRTARTATAVPVCLNDGESLLKFHRPCPIIPIHTNPIPAN